MLRPALLYPLLERAVANCSRRRFVLNNHNLVPSTVAFFHQSRFYSEQPKKSFISNLIDTIKDEMQKNKDLEENLRKLKQETEKLEQSEALQKAREKYDLVEKETLKSSQVLKEKLQELSSQISQRFEEAKKTPLGRKGVELGENVVKTAKDAAETLSRSAEALSKNEAYKSVAEGMKTVKKEIDDITLWDARLYKKPETLKKRDSYVSASAGRVVEPDPDATGMVLTKESKFYAKWKDFTDNNPYYNKFIEMKMKYEESDNRFVQATRFFTDKISDAVSSMFSQSAVAEVLSEINKVDPEFDKEKFLRECELQIIPNIIEASLSGDLEVLKDWCYERSYATMSHLFVEAQRAGYVLYYKVLDVDNVMLAGGQMTEMGPVFALSFRTQQLRCLQTPDGKSVQGNPDQILQIQHVWAFCRDMEELNPNAAWKLLEAHESAKPMLI